MYRIVGRDFDVGDAREAAGEDELRHLGFAVDDLIGEIGGIEAEAVAGRIELQAVYPAMDGIADKVGYASRSHFSRAFNEQFGCSPMEFRKQQH